MLFLDVIRNAFVGRIFHVPMSSWRLDIACRLCQFFNFEPTSEKWDKEGFSWTDSKGQIWNAYEYGTKGEAFISSVDKRLLWNCSFLVYVYIKMVWQRKVIGVGYSDP